MLIKLLHKIKFMLVLKLYLYNSTIAVVSTCNSIILKYKFCILFTENCLVKSLLQKNNNEDKKLFLMI